MSDISIVYEFVLPDGSVRRFAVGTDQPTQPPNPTPDWCRLSFQQCPSCPLPKDSVRDCPAASGVAAIVEAFASVRSYDEIEARALAGGREVRKHTTVQEGLSSLMGATLAASACPVLSRLKPLVRFHLPFASEEETVFRAVSMYLVGQFLVQEAKGKPDWSLEGLAALYRQISEVNRAFAGRLRVAARNDANLNALVVLDTFAKALPDTIQERLVELRYLYEQ